MKHLLLAFLFLFSTMAFSQTVNKKDKVIYYDKNWKSTSKEDASFMRIIKDYSADEVYFHVTDYHIEGEKYMEGRYLEPYLKTRDGEFIWYYRNGKKLREVTYKKGKETGAYQNYYSDGSVKIIGEYKSIVEGESTIVQDKILTFYDSLGLKTVDNGRGYYYECYPSLTYCASGTLKNGLKNGQWTGYDSLENLAYLESYRNGNLVFGESTDSNGKKYNYREILRGPIISSGEKLLYAYINDNIKYPRYAMANNIQGKVYVRFTISNKGHIEDIKTVKGIGGGCDEEAERIIKDIPYKWSPSLRRGKETSQSLILPISFYLQ